MSWPSRRVVTGQFLIYFIGGLAAFVAWIFVGFNQTALLELLAGSYLSDHFVRWTSELSLWGPLILVSSILALASAILIHRANRIGGYLGVISFGIGFAVDVLLAKTLFVHLAAGALIGWILLVPLLTGWDELFEQ